VNDLTRFARFALLLLVVVSGAVAAQDVARQSKREIMRRLGGEVYTGQSYDLLATTFPAGFAWVGAGAQSLPLADWRADVEALSAALPDLEARTVEVLSSGTWAATLVQLDGTFDAPLNWRGVALTPNHQAVRWLQFDIVDFGDDQRAVQGFTERDTLGLLAQLGGSVRGPQAVQPVQASGAASAQAAQAVQPNAASAAFTRQDEERFQATLDQFLEAAPISQDTAQLAPFFSDDFQVVLPQGAGTLGSLSQWLVNLQAALRNIVLETPVQFVDDEYAAVRLHIRGDFLGQWTDESGAQIMPNGLPVTLTLNLLARFNRDGEIAALWLVYDRGDWLTQLTTVAPYN
jgi:predicted ester cyclase